MHKTEKFVNDNIDKFIAELGEFLKFESISTLPEKTEEMKKCAEFTAAKMLEAGLDKAVVLETGGHPVVYGERLRVPGAPTVLIYGHYDVQPVDPVELWSSAPFDPVIKDGKIFARGATDDKGQLYMHIKAVQTILANSDELPLNVKFIIEGEEEIGSPSLEPFLKANKELLKCDVVLVSDTALYAPMLPTLTYGLRGLCYMEIEVTGPNRDLHSGTFGGAVANPINILSQMISKMHDENGKVAIPGFYDDVLDLTTHEREELAKLEFSEAEYKAHLDVNALWGEKGYTVIERTGARPTLDCNGIWGGFSGAGAKTVIPSKASAKISMRLVANQNPEKIAVCFTDYVKQITPESVKVKVSAVHGAEACLVPIESPAISAAAKALSRAFGKETVYQREGGSIPVVAKFKKYLGADSVLMGLGLNTENLHSPDEHFDLNHFRLGIISSAYFMEEYSGK
ncbi:MAG: dipeptidase [Bacteroidetes bacterium]|nr:dipeptidase [Bacteroidota bacterium]